jgi:hypothetical protein
MILTDYFVVAFVKTVLGRGEGYRNGPELTYSEASGKRGCK